MSWGTVLFDPTLINDGNLSEVADELRGLFTDDDGDDLSGTFAVKVEYVDGRRPKTYRDLMRSEDYEGDDEEVVDFNRSDYREPPTVSSELVLTFDDETFRFETREDWTIEWQADEYCVVLTATRPLGDIQRVTISADKS